MRQADIEARVFKMAQVSDLVTRHCLVWDIEKPYIDMPRKSSNFSLLGSEWNFEMCLYYDKKYRFKITLQKVADDEPLEEDITITTFICGRSRETCLYRVSTGRAARQDIWSCTETAEEQIVLTPRYGKCRIVFYIDAPCMQRQSMSETELGSLGTVMDFARNCHGSSPSLSTVIKSLYSEDKCVQASAIDISSDPESQTQDFYQLLEHKIFPDVQLRCGGRSIPSHRSILALRSDIFAAMFRNKMAEGETGTVDITDVDVDVLDLLLKYVYSGKIPELSDVTASSLFAAADKYSIHGLKTACSDWMVGGLTAENCLDFLILADAHSDEDFKDRVVSFVVENMEALGEEALSEFIREHSDLTFGVLGRSLVSTLSKHN